MKKRGRTTPAEKLVAEKLLPLLKKAKDPGILGYRLQACILDEIGDRAIVWADKPTPQNKLQVDAQLELLKAFRAGLKKV